MSIRDVAAKAITDPAFRKELLANPEECLKKHGFELTDKEIEAFRRLKESDFEGITLEELDERLSKSEEAPIVIGVGLW
ncbi:MAG: Franean1_4349 family RiPP [Acetobacteraceae bacterium]|nr:Franean1_4349 family RiPP [Acetobacteraceae bacterium]